MDNGWTPWKKNKQRANKKQKNKKQTNHRGQSSAVVQSSRKCEKNNLKFYNKVKWINDKTNKNKSEPTFETIICSHLN